MARPQPTNKPTILRRNVLDAPLINSKKWDQEKVQFILNKTYDLEIKIKSGSYSNPNLLIKKLLIDICETATSQ